MKNKLVRAYWTAWRWPEVYSDSPSVIWASRVIAIVVPLTLLTFTFLTGLAVFGWIAVVLSGLLAVLMVAYTISVFDEEYDTVENYKHWESSLQEYFHGFPAITSVPVIEETRGEWIAYGHIDPEVFLNAIQRILGEICDDPTVPDAYTGREELVEHTTATFLNPARETWGDGIRICEEGERNCFPVTRISIYDRRMEDTNDD